MLEPFHADELTLTGLPRERGRIHGEILRSQIHDAIVGSGDAVREAGLDPDRIRHQIVHQPGFLAAAERWTPDLVEEVRGIAEGAGLSFDALMTWQLVQEMAWYPAKHIEIPVATACTSLGSCPSPEATIVAQTVDGTGWGHGRELITHFTDPDTGIRSHIIGWPGHIGVYGLNDRGIGICCNSMFMDVSNSSDGLGALFTVRAVLAQPTFEDADRFIRTVPHASGTNFMVGGPGHAASYEVSAKGVATYAPSPHATITYHTNHVMANEDRVLPSVPGYDQPGWDTNSRTRFASAQRRMENLDHPMTWEDAREIISSHDEEHPICRHYKGDTAGMTLFGLIMECSSSSPVIHISTGPPCSTEFRAFGF